MPDHDFNAPRLHVDEPLVQGRGFPASAPQSNYLLNVLRLGDGDDVLLFNGRDGEWRARIGRASRKSAVLEPVERTREQTQAADLHYLFAPLKSARLDYMVQKATEMGVGALRPVLTQHTQNPRFNVQRAQANAVEAAEQCGILSVPHCAEPQRLVAAIETWDPARRLFFCDEREGPRSPIETLGDHEGRPLALLIGPEGGFSQEERTLLTACEFVVPISLGPRILRADTAAVAALALVQAVAGDWAGDARR